MNPDHMPRNAPRNETPEWDGKGLPPVGCECKFASSRDTGDDDECATWEIARVVGYDGPSAVVAIDGGGYAGSSCRGDFRPLRTAEQKARDAIQDSPGQRQSLTKYQARMVYAAIRDGKIPGVRLEAGAA